MPSDYEVRLRKLRASDEPTIVPMARNAGRARGVMGITSPGRYDQLDEGRHRTKISDSDIRWFVHGDPNSVFDMIVWWRSHGNIEVTLITESNHT
jgi:hypothetical protein